MAAPVAVVVVQVVAEGLPVPAVVDLAHLPVLALARVVARRVHRVQLPLLARLPVLAKAHLVVEPAVLVDLLSRHSRQLFSAAMARNTPSPRATYEPVPRSR